MFMQKNGSGDRRDNRFERDKNSGITGGAQLISINLQALPQNVEHESEAAGF